MPASTALDETGCRSPPCEPSCSCSEASCGGTRGLVASRFVDPVSCRADGRRGILRSGVGGRGDHVLVGRIDHIEAFPASCVAELAVDEQQRVVDPTHVAPLCHSATWFRLEYSYLTISALARTLASDVVGQLSEQG